MSLIIKCYWLHRIVLDWTAADGEKMIVSRDCEHLQYLQKPCSMKTFSWLSREKVCLSLMGRELENLRSTLFIFIIAPQNYRLAWTETMNILTPENLQIEQLLPNTALLTSPLKHTH